MTAIAAHDVLFELGTEELPPKALEKLAGALRLGIVEGLTKAGLSAGSSHQFAAPRRLAVWLQTVPEKQPEQRQERRGPALSAAFDDSGQPTKAARGFARSCGVEVTDLQRLETDKGTWLAYTRVTAGAATADLLPGIIEAALASLPIPKRMRWGDRNEEFVRPIHWVLLLFGQTTVPATILGTATGEVSYGHRFHHPERIRIAAPNTYADQLREQGKVIADFAERRDSIKTRVAQLAVEAGGQAVIEPALLDEVTALVEWPVPLCGGFDERFLHVPSEVLTMTMQDNQKYFPIVDANGSLLPKFITVANIDSSDPKKVVAGNERVIRPRFSDAEFFWQQDLKRPLDSYLDALRDVVFQQKLGSLHDKSIRVAGLAVTIAEQSGFDSSLARRAAVLAKCDLLTHMVQEFPELQGTMGRYYADHANEPRDVALALEEQYRPRFAGDDLPQTQTGRTLALAERLDTLVGIFAIGQGPTGTKDPFALRRAALGVLRLIIETDWDLDLIPLLEQAAQQINTATQIETVGAVPQVFQFLIERLRGYVHEQGTRLDVFESVLECNPTRPADFNRRLNAVSTFLRRPEAESLAAANKRIRNILKKADAFDASVPLRVALLQEPAEQQLAQALSVLSQDTQPLFDDCRYGEALDRLATLKQPVDLFFDTVMVMTDDQQQRDNRLALLHRLSTLFLRVADFSKLQN